MELRQLRYFATVAEELHFGRAAERLLIAQSVVSQQIRRLERELGVTLFDRSPRHVRLTEAGQAFLPEAQAVLDAQLRAVASVARYTEHRASILRLGTSSGLGDRLTTVLNGLARRLPDTQVDLVSTPMPERLTQVAEGALDAAFLRGNPDAAPNANANTNTNAPGAVQPQAPPIGHDPLDAASSRALLVGRDASDAASLRLLSVGRDALDAASSRALLAGRDASDAVSLRALSAGRDVLHAASLQMLPVWRDALVVVLPRKHPAAEAPDLALTDLAELPLWLVDRRTNRALVDLVVGACHDAGFEPTLGRVYPGLQETLAAFGAGTPGWTVMYEAHASQLTARHVVFTRLSKPDLSLPTLLAVRQGVPETVVEALLASCREAA